MNGYREFSGFYDLFAQQMDYPELARKIHQLICSHKSCEGNLLLELACGTGNLSFELERIGYDVIGTDISEEMLSVALHKKLNKASDCLFLCQNMTQLDLFGTVDAVVCMLDGINHLTDYEELKAAFSGVSLFLSPGGLFVFDANTLYKHRKILENNTFIYDYDEAFLSWRNTLREDSVTVDIELDIFVPDEDGRYERITDSFSERAYTDREIIDALRLAGLSLVYTECQGEEKKLYLAVKEKKQWQES